MKNKIFLYILIIILLGIIIGLLIPNSKSTTLLACPCRGVEGERSCNTIHEGNFIFVTGLFNIVRECKGTEIIVCHDDSQINEYNEIDYNNCKIRFYILYWQIF